MYVFRRFRPSLIASRNISLGRLVHSFNQFSFRSTKLWWKVAKTFVFKIPLTINFIGLMLNDLVCHSSGEKEVNFPSKLVLCARRAGIQNVAEISNFAQKNVFRKQTSALSRKSRRSSIADWFDSRFHKNPGVLLSFVISPHAFKVLRIIGYWNKNSDYPLFFPVKFALTTFDYFAYWIPVH